MTQRNKGIWRPNYHFTAKNGWINDPNGLIYYKGNYHLFYQYNPKDCEWGSMHWGHAVSKDMMHWKDLPIALTPDQPYDNCPEGGCFSGSAVEKDGILYLFYTGAVKKDGKLIQTQCMAYSEDGIHFHKYEHNPIISNPPEGYSFDFRDPKVFYAEDKWYMVLGGSLGGAETGGDGRIFLYESKDLFSWNYKGNVLESHGKLGTMMECPDLFPLKDKWILICSPMYHPEYIKTLYCIGTMDFEHCVYEVEKIGTIDDGFDYYAPQTFEDEEGSRVMIGWQNSWKWMPWCEDFGPTDQEGYRGVLGFPRIIILDHQNNLQINPIKNIENLVTKSTSLENVYISKDNAYKFTTDNNSFELKVRINKEKILSRFFEISICSYENKRVSISLDFIDGIITVDRNNADIYSHGKISKVFDQSKESIDLHVFVDRSCIEIFVDNGKIVMTCNIYPVIMQIENYISVPYKEMIIDKIIINELSSIWG